MVYFGEGATDKATYKNRRAELYGTLAGLMDPDHWRLEKKVEIDEHGEEIELDEYDEESRCFVIDPDDGMLREELYVMPILLDSEGKMKLPPKDRQGNAREKSLRDMLGRSPDRADALALAAFISKVEYVPKQPGGPDWGKPDMSWSQEYLGGRMR